jgi:hypothetical protein
MHLFASLAAEKLLHLWMQPAVVETESTWGGRLAARR